jgi:hypothetical protein
MPTKKKIIKDKLICVQCDKEKDKMSGFYNSSNDLFKKTGKVPICKQCIKEMIDYDDMDSIYKLLRQIDVKFDYTYWDKAKESKSDTFGRYIAMANSLPQFENTSWDNSVFEAQEDEEDKDEPYVRTKKFKVTDEIVDKWGMGYSVQEYEFFERKYRTLKNNYQEKTAMHTEALLTYVRYRVKEEVATAKGDVKSAKEWGSLAQKAAQDAKINPSQLSKSDLSDGLDTFGQLVRTVEQAVDIIPILPQFKEKPHDKPDFTMWCYINYIRDLKGLPIANYEDVYRFYDDRKREMEGRLDFLKDDE